MAWPPTSTFPVESPIQPGWWTVLSYNRLVERGRADRLAREQANEQAKRIRRLRRRVERLDEAIVIALGAAEARQYRRRQLYQHGSHQIGSWGAGHGEIEHSAPYWGPVLGVR